MYGYLSIPNSNNLNTQPLNKHSLRNSHVLAQALVLQVRLHDGGGRQTVAKGSNQKSKRN